MRQKAQFNGFLFLLLYFLMFFFYVSYIVT